LKKKRRARKSTVNKSNSTGIRQERGGRKRPNLFKKSPLVREKGKRGGGLFQGRVSRQQKGKKKKMRRLLGKEGKNDNLGF